MYLKYGDNKLNIDFNPTQDVISKHSEKPLRSLQLIFITDSITSVNNILDLIKISNNRIVLGDNTGEESTWKVGNNGYSYTDNVNPIYKLWIDVVQEENLNPESLLIDTLELFPYEYEEDFFDDRLRVDAKVLIDLALFEELISIFYENRSVSVLRKGISEQPREMEIVLGTWSIDGEKRKLWIHLSDINNEPRKTKLFPLVELGVKNRNLREQSIAQSHILLQLVELLRQKQIINGDEINQLLTFDNQPLELFTRKFDFNRDDDIDN
ncbi:MAG: hypothetical protein ACYDGL_00730 [Bellilinea sp.]